MLTLTGCNYGNLISDSGGGLAMFKTIKDHPIFAVIGAVAAITGIVIGVLSLVEPKYAKFTSGAICGNSEETITTHPYQFRECKNPNKVKGYEYKEDVSQSSGWVGGGHDQNWHCTNVKRRKEAAVGQSIVWSNQRSSEQSKKSTLGKVSYKYHCTITAQWTPIYEVERWEGCGEAPPKIEIIEEPKTCFDKTQRIGWKWSWE